MGIAEHAGQIAKKIVVKQVRRIANDAINQATVAVASAGLSALEKASEAMDVRMEGQVSKFLNEESGSVRLAINRSEKEWNVEYSVVDASSNELYHFSDSVFLGMHKIRIKNGSGNNIGSIIEKSAVKDFIESNDISNKVFEITIGGQTIGRIKSKLSLVKARLKLDIKDWEIEGDIINKNYIVYEHEFPVMKVTYKSSPSQSAWMLNVHNPKDILLGTIVAVVLDIVAKR